MKRLGTFVTIILLASAIAALVACGKSGGESSDGPPSDLKEQAKLDDQVAREEINEPNHAEAREWLRNPLHTVFEGERRRIVSLVDEFYAAGATRVLVTGIEKIMDSDVTATLVVELPSDKATRKKLFDVESAWQKEVGDEPTPDVD